MEFWDKTYASGHQMNNVDFPEQFLIKILMSSEVRKRISSNPSLLDLGCGYGRNIPLFKKITKNILCVDPSKTAIDFVAKKHSVESQVFVPGSFSVNGEFDIIIACNSIYYVSDDINFFDYFSSIVKLLKPQGMLVVSFLGERHSILHKSEFVGDDHYVIRSDHEKFRGRNGQKIYVPANGFEPANFGMKIFSFAEISDNFDGDVRHLYVYCLEAKEN